MKLSNFIILAVWMLAVVLPMSANAQAQQNCTATSADPRQAPIITPSPDYVSDHDGQVAYGRVVYRDRLGRKMLDSPLKNFAQTQAVFADWERHLETAEKDFWAAYDATGTVDQQKMNEYAYWLHKREWFAALRVNTSVEAQMRVSKDMAEVFKLFMGGATNAFLKPYEFTSTARASYLLPTDASVESVLKDPKYQKYSQSLSRYLYLTKSSCAPGQQGTAAGTVLGWMLFPDMDYDEVIKDFEVYEDLLPKKGKDFSDVVRFVEKLMDDDLNQGVRNGKAVRRFFDENSAGADKRKINALLARWRPEIKRVKIKGPTGSKVYYQDWEKTEFPAQELMITLPQKANSQPLPPYEMVSLPAFNGADLVKCTKPQSRELNERMYQKHQRAYERLFEHTLHGMGIQVSLANLVIASCVMDGGLDNPQIQNILNKLQID